MKTLVALSLIASLASTALASDIPTKLLWGDTHLHTANSGDAVLFGGSIDTETAYRFARGEPVMARSGQRAQLHRPLDFLVVSDHAEAFGLLTSLDHPLMQRDPEIIELSKKSKESPKAGIALMTSIIARVGRGDGPVSFTDPEIVGTVMGSAWQKNADLAEKYNEPGVFTAFIGYEWSSHPGGDNLHRVVVFKDGAEKAKQVLPFSALTSQNPKDLWAWMQRYQDKTQGQLLAIPHNSNLSGGLMFPVDIEQAGQDAEYLQQRKRWEPIVEISQIKGDSEAHPVLSPNDEFANHGNTGWDNGNLAMNNIETDQMHGGEYIREALKRGLVIEDKYGVNPYQFGVIGSTDSHTGLSTVEEDNFWGKHSGNEPGPGRVQQIWRQGKTADNHEIRRVGWQYESGAYAAVWAKENTREAIFEAMQNKEVYSTTGTRIALRVFAGWNFDDTSLGGNDWLVRAYKEGVPMGGGLPVTRQSSAPKLLIVADKDPLGANLDRVQVVKGWLDANGHSQEQVYNVAWSHPEQRQLDAQGALPAVGNTVDIATGKYTNSIGTNNLSVVWSDPDFNPALSAFYYVRVLEIPTPRWPVFDAIRYGVELPDDAVLIHQERAYSSPVWYQHH